MRNKLRLEKRESVSTIRIVLTSILFTLIAFAFCGIIIASVGFNPLEVYGKMLNKVFLSEKGIRKMINASLPLMFCGLGVALTFKMNLNNIGAEGQYAMGAIFGGAFVLYGTRDPRYRRRNHPGSDVFPRRSILGIALRDPESILECK